MIVGKIRVPINASKNTFCFYTLEKLSDARSQSGLSISSITRLGFEDIRHKDTGLFIGIQGHSQLRLRPTKEKRHDAG